MSWKTSLNDYFCFSRAERFGILTLCAVILLALAVMWSLPAVWTTPKFADTSVFAREITHFRQAADLMAQAKIQAEPVQIPPAYEYFYFDPNRATDNEWKRLGLNRGQIRNIRNYLAKGGNFKQKEDLRRMYTISAQEYERMAPYIRIAANRPKVTQLVAEANTNASGQATVTPPRETSLQIELNTADSSLLTQLPGIGPVLAARTIKYRNIMGGFVCVAQLGEVYGVSGELLNRLASQLTADSTLIKKIPANRAAFGELARHPYLNRQQVRAILYYRNAQNHIHHVNELVENNILKAEEAEKIKPYLSFD